MKRTIAFVPLLLSVFVPVTVLSNYRAEAASVISEQVPTYSKSEIQAGLTKSIENYYYKFKDQPIPNPIHKVSDIKVLQYVQRGHIVGVVGQCDVDGKQHIVTGILGRYNTRNEWQFGGGWHQATSKEIFWAVNGTPFKNVAFISGIASNHSITQLRITHLNGQTAVIPVSKDGYFTSFIDKPEIKDVKGTIVFVDGLDHTV